MTSMTVYDIQVVRKDKTIVEDRTGPYYGSYFENDPDLKKRCKELYEADDTFIVIVKSASVMA